MTKKIGMVIPGNTLRKSCFILEEGGGKRVYQFDPQTVDGNIDLDPQARQYPTRLKNKIVKFIIDENGVVTTVSTLVFSTPVHDKCACGAVTMGAKRCACGNTTSGTYKHCEVCAIKSDQCVLCGQSLG